MQANAFGAEAEVDAFRLQRFANTIAGIPSRSWLSNRAVP
jgi:hypothetical protein